MLKEGVILIYNNNNNSVKLTPNNVVSSLQKILKDNKYETYHIGPELRYVGPLSISNNNNLEEEILLGEEKLVKTQVYDVSSDNNYYKYQEFEFRQKDAVKNFYVLKVTENLTKTRPIKIEAKRDEFEIFSLYLEYNDDIPSVTEEEAGTEGVLIKKFELYYKEEVEKGTPPVPVIVSTLISTREIRQFASYNDGNRKTVMTEEIIIPNNEVQGE